MKNNNIKLFMGIIFAVILSITGCATENGTNDKDTWLKEHGGEVMNYPYTKTEIEAEVDAKWQEYGYKEKPTKYIALSFDDGPCPASSSGGTTAMLAKLDELNVKTTFFVIGPNVRGNKAVAQAIFEKGHELGNHSDGYGSLGGESTSVITSSLNAASLAIKEITGKYPCLFRAPNLNHGDNLSKVCEERGMALIDGSAHSDWDGTGYTPTTIKKSVLDSAQNGSIVILHDNNTSKGNTMNALTDIVNGLREKGFWILTIGQLAVVKEKSLIAGERYSSIN